MGPQMSPPHTRASCHRIQASSRVDVVVTIMSFYIRAVPCRTVPVASCDGGAAVPLPHVQWRGWYDPVPPRGSVIADYGCGVETMGLRAAVLLSLLLAAVSGCACVRTVHQVFDAADNVGDCEFSFPEIPSAGTALDSANDAPTVVAMDKLVYFGASVNVPGYGLAYVFDFATCQWAYFKTPLDYVGGTANVVNDLVYVIGGGRKGVNHCNPRHNGCRVNDVYQVNVTGAEPTFTKMSSLETDLVYQASVVFEDNIVVVGGYERYRIPLPPPSRWMCHPMTS